MSARRPCVDAERSDPTAQIIEQCTAIIESGRASENELRSAYRIRGMAYFLSQDPNYERALRDMSEAVDRAASPTVFVNRGRIYGAQQNYVAALADFDRAIILDPNFASAYYHRGIAHAERREFSRAISDIDRAAELSPDEYAYHHGRCRVRIIASVELDIARTACDEAIRLRPGDWASLLLRGMVGIKQARWQNAWSDFDRLLERDGNDTTAMFGRGLAAIGLGRIEEGRDEISRATELNSSVAADFATFGISP